MKECIAWMGTILVADEVDKSLVEDWIIQPIENSGWWFRFCQLSGL